MFLLFVNFLQGLVLGTALACIILVIFLMILLPQPPPTKQSSSPPSVSPLSTSSPSMQMWVGLLPSSYLPFSASRHTPDMAFSARITVSKDKVVVEYPDRNIVEEEEMPSTDVQFLAYKETLDMNRAGFSFLPVDIKSKEMFSKEFPMLVEEQRQFVIFCNSSREKEDLYRALVDSSTYTEDSKQDLEVSTSTNCDHCMEGRRETQSKRRYRFMTYLEGKIEWREMGEICQLEPLFDNHSLLFINSLIHHMFYIVKDEQFTTDFLHKNLVHKLQKIKFLTKHFPNHWLEDINSGISPPEVVDVLKPYQDKQGLFLPVKVEYHGVSSVKMLLDSELSEEELWPMSFVNRLRNYLFSKIYFKLELLSLRGDLCFNVEQSKTDRIWFGFSSEPQMELQLFLMVGGKRWENLLVDRLLQLGIKRMKMEFKQSLVLPNMNDIPVKFLKFDNLI